MKRLLAIVATTVLLASCSEGSPQARSNPEDALLDAVEALVESEGLTMTIGLSGDAESLQALSEPGGEPLPRERAEALTDWSYTATTTKEDGNKANIEVVLNLAGVDALEVKIVGDTAYGRADLPHLLETFGQDTATLTAFERRIAGQLDFARPALDGEWLSVSNIYALAEQFSGGVSQGDPLSQQKMVEGLARILKQSASVKFEGDEEPGAHLVVSLDVRALYGELLGSVAARGAGFPFSGGFPEPAIDGEDIDVDVWIDDGRLTQVGLDFAQLGAEAGIPEGLDEFGVTATFDEFSGEIEPPGDSIEVALPELFRLFSGAFGGTRSESGSATKVVPAEPDCAQFKDLPPGALEGLDADTRRYLKGLCPRLF